MERAVRLFAAVNFLVIGLSHVVQHRAWAEFFVWLRSRGRAGVFANGFLSLGFGSIVVAFHPVWTGVPMLLTLYGWGLVVKGLVAFVVPSLSMKGLNRVSLERSWEFIVPGVVFLVFGAVLLYGLWVDGTGGP